MVNVPSFQFENTFTVDDLITEAWARTKRDPSIMTGWDAFTAKKSINLMFCEWLNRGMNLFTVAQTLIPLTPGQSDYNVPIEISDIINGGMALQNMDRKLGGEAASSPGGVAANAFDGNPNTACTLSGPNGYIQYHFEIAGDDDPQAIKGIGIVSENENTYTLEIQHSFDGSFWITSLVTPETFYIAGQIQWFVVPVGTKAPYWRIQEINGATLSIQELYFSTFGRSQQMTRISLSAYNALPNKTTQAIGTSYLFDRTKTPPLSIWPTPDTTYQAILMYYERSVEDVSQLAINVPLPQRFFDPAAAGLAWRLSEKGNVDPAQCERLFQQAERAYLLAAQEDVQDVPLQIYPQIMPGSWR